MRSPRRAARTAALAGALLAGPVGAEHGHPGEAHYRRICFICHDRGVHHAGAVGAPRLGDRRAWEGRARRGVDVLLNTVVHGRGGAAPQMPTGGLEPHEIRAAIEYMLLQADLH